MKKLLLITAVIFLSFQSYSQWESQESPTQKKFKEVFFLDENIGWISGSWYLNAANSDSVLLYTSNGGENWEEISNEYIFGKIQFMDEYTGWALNHVHTWNKYLIKTNDGGHIWDTCFFFSEYSGVVDFEFFNHNDGILLLKKDGILYQLFTTNDGGNSWTGGALMNSMFCVDFINMQTAYFLKWSSYMGWPLGIYKSDSVGYGMQYVNGLMVYDIFFLNESNGFARKENAVYKTQDSANTYTGIYSGGYGSTIPSMWFEDENTGWVIERSNEDNIHHTNNSGQSWVNQYSNYSAINNIFFINSTHGWAVGDNGTILHTTNGGSNLTLTTEYEPNSELVKIYPNPVSETVNIEFIVEEQGMVFIDVHNSMGKKVSSPISRIYSQGLHKLKWDVTNLDEGLYFCRYTNGKSSTTKQIIKMQ